MNIHVPAFLPLKVPFMDLRPQQEEIADEVLPLLEDIVRSGAFIGGDYVTAFEQAFADFINVNDCVGVGNGTDALELALAATGVARGMEVILPANTFIATVEAVVRTGATPILVDVDPDHLLIDPDAVQAAITQRTAAIIPVHLFGQVAPVDLLSPIADRAGAVVVEDAAQSQGAIRYGKRAGSLGTVAATSFYPGKNLGAAGDAGAVTTNDASLARKIRMTANHGSEVKYSHESMGRNSRLDALQAAVLLSKLRRLELWNSMRRRAASRYEELLSDIDGVDVPSSMPGNEDVWHLYVIRLQNRDAVAQRLQERGISTGIHYPLPIHRTSAWKRLELQSGGFPVADAAAKQILSLPLFPHISEDQQVAVASALRAAIAGNAL